jgi:RHS repeat-associated protein
MKNNLNLSRSFIILPVLAVLFAFSASAWGCGGGGGGGCSGCNPPCGPCQTCNCGTCVNNCLSSQCKSCVNGSCQSICDSSACKTCDGYGHCGISCDPNECLICDGQGHCISCDSNTERCDNGRCVPLFSYVNYTYDGVGNRTSMIDSAGTTSYNYDYLNRLTSVTDPNNKTISCQYDRNGNRTQLTDPNGGITAYAYDEDNRLIDVNASTASTTYQYDSLGRLTRANYPNGTYTQYSYNPQRNWLTTLVNKNSSGTVLSSFSYTYDYVGNRLSVTEANSSAVSYGYDNIYQLTSETRTGTNSYSITYHYDDIGNRTQMVKNGATTNYTYNNDNQLTTETTGSATVTYSYDLNGNLVSKTAGSNTTTCSWDWGNRLLSVSEPGGNTAYEYNGDGVRISKTQSGVKTKYINDVAFGLTQVIMETNNAGIVQATYTYGRDLISMNRADANSYYLYDGLGSVKQMTDSNEAVVASYTYNSFGNVIASSGTIENNYKFTGEQFDSSSGLLYLRARYYDSRVGRFISRDSIGYQGGINLYTYVRNNPVMFTDPSGNCPGDPCWKSEGYKSLSACVGDKVPWICGPVGSIIGGIGGGIGIFIPPIGVGAGAWGVFCAGAYTAALNLCLKGC